MKIDVSSSIFVLVHLLSRFDVFFAESEPPINLVDMVVQVDDPTRLCAKVFQ